MTRQMSRASEPAAAGRRAPRRSTRCCSALLHVLDVEVDVDRVADRRIQTAGQQAPDAEARMRLDRPELHGERPARLDPAAAIAAEVIVVAGEHAEVGG